MRLQNHDQFLTECIGEADNDSRTVHRLTRARLTTDTEEMDSWEDDDNVESELNFD